MKCLKTEGKGVTPIPAPKRMVKTFQKGRPAMRTMGRGQLLESGVLK